MDNIVNREDFIALWANNTGNTKKHTREMLNAFENTVMDVVAEGDTLFLSGFLKLNPKFVDTRVARDPNTQKEISVPAKYKVMSKAGAALVAAANERL